MKRESLFTTRVRRYLLYFNAAALVSAVALFVEFDSHSASKALRRLEAREAVARIQCEVVTGQVEAAVTRLAAGPGALRPERDALNPAMRLAFDVLNKVGVAALWAVHLDPETQMSHIRTAVLASKWEANGAADFAPKDVVRELCRRKLLVSTGAGGWGPRPDGQVVAFMAPVLDESGRVRSAVGATLDLDSLREFLGVDGENTRLYLQVDGRETRAFKPGGPVDAQVLFQGEEFGVAGRPWRVGVSETRRLLSETRLVAVVMWVLCVHVGGSVLFVSIWRKTVYRYQALVDSIRAAVFVTDPLGNVRYANRYAVETFGLPPGYAGTSLETVHPEDRDLVRRRRESIIGDEVRSGRNRNLSADGRVLWLDWTNCRITPRSDRHSDLISVGFDVTELIEAKDRYATLVETMDAVVFIIDDAGRIRYANPFTHQLFGYEPDSLVGRIYEEIVHRDDLPEVRAIVQNLPATEMRRNYNRNIRRDGGIVSMAWLNRRLPSSNGTVPELMCVGVDITSLLHKYDEAMRTMADRAAENRSLVERYERRDDFLRKNNHDLRSPLISVIRIADHLSQPGLPPGKVAERLKRIKNNVGFVLQLLRDMMALAEGDSVRRPVWETFPAEEWVQENRDLLGHHAADLPLVRFDVRVDPNAREMHCDRYRCTRILSNLLRNALEAFDGPNARGCITVLVRRDERSQVLEVADSGKGMSEEELRRYVEGARLDSSAAGPAVGERVHMGLKIVAQTVQQLGGDWSVESTPGRGTQVTVRLPAEPPPHPPLLPEATTGH